MMEKERAGRSLENHGSVAIGNVTCALLVYAAPPTQTYHESQTDYEAQKKRAASVRQYW